MTPESSPFRPGQPVPAELFVGRRDAIERLRGLVRAAGRGVFKIGFISGERGIGKSSLASFVRRLCERDGDVTGCHVYLGGVRDLHEMAGRIFDRLLKDSIDRPWHRQSDRYRSILRKMADQPARMTFQRGDLAARLAPAERQVLDNFLRRMRKLGAVQLDPEARGGYRFPNRLHALYFWLESRLKTGI